MKAFIIACIALSATLALADSEKESYLVDRHGVIIGVVGEATDPNSVEAPMSVIKASLPAEIDPNNLTLSGQSGDEQEFMENNPLSMIQNTSGGTVNAVLDYIGGRYLLTVDTPTSHYTCLASPGNPAVKGAVATPHFQNKTPYNIQDMFIVLPPKPYAGAKMPWPVWIQGGFAIHGGDGGGPPVTGQRASHGCIRLACAHKFHDDVKAVGLINTRITVKTN
jgi:hypothetical protein